MSTHQLTRKLARGGGWLAMGDKPMSTTELENRIEGKVVSAPTPKPLMVEQRIVTGDKVELRARNLNHAGDEFAILQSLRDAALGGGVATFRALEPEKGANI